MFTGSGTTGLAALQLGRRFTGIELSPAFARSPPNGSAKRAGQIVKPVSHDRPSTAGDHDR